MNLRNVDFRKIAALTNSFSGAEIKSVCTEAGYFAIRSKRTHVGQEDFLTAINKVKKGDDGDEENPTRMFG